MEIGELIGLGIETMIVSLCMKIISLLIPVMLYGRMIEIYLYVSVAPVPFATFSNREWGGIGNNYINYGGGQSAHGTMVGGSVYRYPVFQFI